MDHLQCLVYTWESDLLLRSAVENPKTVCDVVKQNIVFILQYSI